MATKQPYTWKETGTLASNTTATATSVVYGKMVRKCTSIFACVETDVKIVVSARGLHVFPNVLPPWEREREGESARDGG